MNYPRPVTNQQALDQLRILGYQNGDRVWLRLLAPKNIPLDLAQALGLTYISKNGEVRKSPIDGYLTLNFEGLSPFTRVWGQSGKATNHPHGFYKLTEWNNQGYGVYLVVNPGGRNDGDITQARSLFFEADKASKAEQLQKIQYLEQRVGNPVSLIIETAKSLHTYLLLSVPMQDLADWKQWQQRLIKEMDSDPAIANPARLMRLAGFYHQAIDLESANAWQAKKAGTEGYEGISEDEALRQSLISTPVQILRQSDSLFTLAELDAVLPTWSATQYEQKQDKEANDFEPTEPTENPWDLRNFAHYLDGYNPSGRRGWITCKCPVHNGESDNSLHINANSGAPKCHSGCDPKAVYHAALEQAKSRGYQLPKGKRQRGKGKKAVTLPNYELTYTPDYIEHTRFLGTRLDPNNPKSFVPNVQIPKHTKFILIRAPKGCGKTDLIAYLCNEVETGRRRILVLTYREQLGIQLAERLALPYKSEVKDRPEGAKLGYVFCIDSMHGAAEVPFTPDGHEDDLVVIDEVESVLWHELNSGTCQEKRMTILDNSCRLLQGVLSPNTQGQLVIADADLSDITVQTLLEMAKQPELKPFVIRSDWKPETGYEAIIYDHSADLNQAMIKGINHGGNHLILLSGQKPTSKWSTITLEAQIRQRFPQKTILRIDSETISDPTHPAYRATKDINQLLKHYQIVIASPTIESGVSIDLKNHFTAIWGNFTGVQPENSIRQFLMRLRDLDVPRHIYIADRGLNTAFIGNRSTDWTELATSTEKKARQQILLLKDFALGIDVVTQSLTYNTAPFEGWARMGARINAGLDNYRAAIIAGLKAEGHSIQYAAELDKRTRQAISEAVGEVRDNNVEIDAKGVSSAKPLVTEQEYEAIKARREKTTDERYSERQYEIKSRYGVDVTPDLVQKDNDGWYSRIRFHYLLTVGAEHLQPREKGKLEKLMDCEQMVWIPDVNNSLIIGCIKSIEALGIHQLLVEGEEFHKDHPLIIEIAKKAFQCRGDVESFLNVHVTEKTKPIRLIQDILDQHLGFRLVEAGQRGTGKQKRRLYRYEPPNDNRFTIFAGWLERDRKAAEKRAEQAETQATAANAEIQQEYATSKSNEKQRTRISLADIDKTALSRNDSDKHIAHHIYTYKDSDVPLDRVPQRKVNPSGATKPIQERFPFPVERGQRVRRISDGQMFEVKEIVKGQLWVRWLNQILNWSAITLPWSDVELVT